MLISTDAGFEKAGYVVFHEGMPIDAGVFETSKTTRKGILVSSDDAARCSALFRQYADKIAEHGCKGIIGELPSGGSKNFNAAKCLAYALCTCANVATALDLPADWCTPGNIKKAVCGSNSASKPQIMEAIIKLYGGKITYKTVKLKTGKTRKDSVYHFLDKKWGAGKFEHIADACGAYLALREFNVVKMFG